jgi:HlyD family secretion protein
LGPQGAALILEMQRLRHAFENEHGDDPGTARPRGPTLDVPVRERRPPPPKRRPGRRRKGKMGRAFDVCLEQFGFRPAEPPKRGHEAPLAPDIPPPRRRGRDRLLAIDDALAMDLTRPAPDMPPAEPLPLIDSPRLQLTRAPEAATPVGQLIARSQTAVVAGVNFLLNRGGLPEPGGEAGDSMTARAGWSFENELRTGLRILLVAGLFGGGWFAFVPLAGAVVVPGNLVVQSNVKTIQHPTGGVVADIKVHDGMHVAAGELLVRLDPTQAQASLQMINKQLDEFRARIARLVAERDGLERPEIPAELAARSSQGSVGSLLASEDSLFKARRHAQQSQKELLNSRISQLTEEISGLDAQVASKAKQLELIAGELSGVQDLYDKRLVPLTRLTTLQREASRLEGERGQLTSAIAETKAKIDEARLQIVRLEQDFRTDVVKELGDTQGKENELVERGVAARDVLDRIEIRSPTSGVIHQLAAHTLGGVIRAGDSIMDIVPDSDELQVEARLQPNDIDQVRIGQKAFVRFSAFNQRTTPQLAGNVAFVAANTSHDQQTNASYFTVRVVLPDDERRRLGGLQLVPGMPAEVFMQTGSRTMMSYLMKPIMEQMARAFVEQ